MNASDLIGTGEIAAMIGLKQAYVRDRVTKRPDFPPPCLRLSQKTVRWSRRDVEEWIRAQTLQARRR